jgi:hypothetical protein
MIRIDGKEGQRKATEIRDLYRPSMEISAQISVAATAAVRMCRDGLKGIPQHAFNAFRGRVQRGRNAQRVASRLAELRAPVANNEPRES